MMATSPPQDSINRAYTPSSTSDPTLANIHRRAMSYTDESNSIPLTATRYAAQHQQQQEHPYPLPPMPLQYQQSAGQTTANGVRLGRSRSLFRRQSRYIPGHVYTQGTVPPIPQAPILQHSGKSASRLLRLEDPILIRIARNFELNELLEFSHLSKRCRAITAKTLTLMLQRTVLKATLCQERKAVFSLEFIFQHLDPASLQAVFRASQLKSRRYFENSALARPVVQALTLVTPNGSHHPLFRLAGFDAPKDYTESMTERELERATTLLARPFELDIKDKGYYRVSPTTSCMVDTPFFPSQPLLDPLVPIVMEGATHGPPSWEMMYKVDLLPPNYPQRVQQQQEKIYQEQVRQAALRGEQPPPPPVPASQTGTKTAGGFVPLPAIKSGPNLRSILPESSPLSGVSDSKTGGSKLQRKPTVVRPPPEGWGPLPPIAPPPAVPASLAYQLGTRTVNTAAGMDHSHHHQQPTSPTRANGGVVPKSPTSANAAPSCLEPELAEETERFLTLLFLQFPIQTLFPFTAASAKKMASGGVSGWLSNSKLGRSLTLKKNQTHRTGDSLDHGRQRTDYAVLDH
ncbi:hypothetical protein BGX28_000664 [Mortierella sp. GBA30]|nr:hypothetical protein BGX28_000664 [Mortierella sp. GBA30]